MMRRGRASSTLRSQLGDNGARLPRAGAQVQSKAENHMQSTNKAGLSRLVRITLATASGIALLALTAIAPAHAAPACSTTITKCGCTITQSKIYTVANDLQASQTSEPNCIEIAKDHAILNTKGWALIGNKKGIGIFIRPGADHVIVEGGDEADNDPPLNPTQEEGPAPTLAPPQSTVALWDIGIRDDGDDATILLFANVGGSFFQQNQGNITGGVFLNRVKNSSVGDLRANFNGKFGVRLDHCSDVEISNVATTANQENGVLLEASNNNRIGPATSAAGGKTQKLGTWLFSSSDNVIHDDANGGNSGTGLLVGCGLDRKNCPGNERSNHNRVIDGAAVGNKDAGLMIRKHSEGNTVTVNHNDGNGGKNMDMVDENNKCDSNIWYNNTGNGNQPCIH